MKRTFTKHPVHCLAAAVLAVLVLLFLWGKTGMSAGAENAGNILSETEDGVAAETEAASEEETELSSEQLEKLAHRQEAQEALGELQSAGEDESLAGLGSDGTWLTEEPGDGGWSLSTPYPFTIMIRFDREFELLSGKQTGMLRRRYKGQAIWDDQALYDYFYELGEKYNTEPGTVRFTTHNGKELTFESPNCGWQMNVDATVTQLKASVGAGEDVMDPCWNSGLVYSSDSDVGSKYVEVDITHQKVYLYEEGELILETDCVTGTKGWTDTHTGVFQVEYKASPAVLRDTDPSGNKYEQPVDFWIAFNHSQGMHDANWRGEFGGDIYLSWGSHGCVNLPREAAERIYHEVYNYYPVIVYETDDTAEEESTGTVVETVEGLETEMEVLTDPDAVADLTWAGLPDSALEG